MLNRAWERSISGFEEVGGAFFVLWGLRPLARQLHLHRGRDRVAQAHPLEPFEPPRREELSRSID